MRAILRLWAPVVLVGWTAGCGSDDSHASGLASDAACALPPCGTDEAGTPDGAADAPEASVIDAEAGLDAPEDAPWTGPTGTITGMAFISNPPAFNTVATEEMPLYYDAAVRVLTASHEATVTHVGGEGFSASEVPVGTWPVVVDDPDAMNGILPSVFTMTVVEGANEWTVPAAAKNAFAVIYGALPSALYVDPGRAQVLLTFSSCASSGGDRLAGVQVEAPTGSEGVVYDAAAGSWEHNAAAGTGINGAAIVVNWPSAPAMPGADAELSYTVAGATHQTGPFRVIQGAVTRVAVEHPCP